MIPPRGSSKNYTRVPPSLVRSGAISRSPHSTAPIRPDRTLNRALWLTITHNFRALREQPKGQVGDNKNGAADNTL